MVFRTHLRHLHELGKLQLFISDVHELLHFRRLNGICHRRTFAPAYNPLQALLLTLMINARHLFYGISMLNRFRQVGFKKLYLIYGMCDETFSINYTAKIPAEIDRGWFMFWVTVLNQFYWVSGATLGGIFGSLIRFNTKGIGFAMTAMFVVIFMEQWLKEKNHWSSLLGFAITGGSLAIFGPENFIIPSMIAILILLSTLRKPLEKRI